MEVGTDDKHSGQQYRNRWFTHEYIRSPSSVSPQVVELIATPEGTTQTESSTMADFRVGRTEPRKEAERLTAQRQHPHAGPALHPSITPRRPPRPPPSPPLTSSSRTFSRRRMVSLSICLCAVCSEAWSMPP